MIVGVLGGGQLGMMLGEAASSLGVSCRFFDPSPDAPAHTAGEVVTAPYDDADALLRFGEGLDAVTYEFENVPIAAASSFDVPVYPHIAALTTAQDRLREKTFFRDLGIPVPHFFPVNSEEDVRDALRHTGFPAVLKTRREGYDGKGQAVIRTEDDIVPAWDVIGGREAITETFVPFERELSIIAIRGQDGSTAYYPLTENTHREGILRLSVAPADADAAIRQKAEAYASQAMDALDYVGVLTLELFQRGGELLVNEMAPRVHNSGHWTIEGAETSQFANHLRAVCGMPLGSTGMRGHAAMLNIIGGVPDLSGLQSLSHVYVHLYGKSPRPGRKLGHVTVVADTAAERDEKVSLVQDALVVPL